MTDEVFVGECGLVQSHQVRGAPSLFSHCTPNVLEVEFQGVVLCLEPNGNDASTASDETCIPTLPWILAMSASIELGARPSLKGPGMIGDWFLG